MSLVRELAVIMWLISNSVCISVQQYSIDRLGPRVFEQSPGVASEEDETIQKSPKIIIKSYCINTLLTQAFVVKFQFKIVNLSNTINHKPLYTARSKTWSILYHLISRLPAKTSILSNGVRSAINQHLSKLNFELPDLGSAMGSRLHIADPISKTALHYTKVVKARSK